MVKAPRSRWRGPLPQPLFSLPSLRLAQQARESEAGCLRQRYCQGETSRRPAGPLAQLPLKQAQSGPEPWSWRLGRWLTSDLEAPVGLSNP